MYEFCNGRDEVKFTFSTAECAELFFVLFSAPGDYVWDGSQVLFANVEAIR